MQSISLPELADEHLAIARGASSGRSAKTFYGGHERSLRQTVVALAGGRGCAEHESPYEATLQVISGTVAVASAGDNWRGAAGDLLMLPPARHDLTAVDDCVVLLTVYVRLQ
jgi:quercetin dioxygenase-like cupin family protein